MSQIRISISGKLGSGKSTLTDILTTEFLKQEKTIQTAQFAEPIKKIVKTVYPNADLLGLYGDSKYRDDIIPGSTGKTYRRALTSLGDAIKSFEPNYLLNIMQNQIDMSQMDVFIITDARFQDELKLAKANDFYRIRITRQTNEERQGMAHNSETNLDNVPDSEFNKIIRNDGALLELRAQVGFVIRELH